MLLILSGSANPPDDNATFVILAEARIHYFLYGFPPSLCSVENDEKKTAKPLSRLSSIAA